MRKTKAMDSHQADTQAQAAKPDHDAATPGDFTAGTSKKATPKKKRAPAKAKVADELAATQRMPASDPYQSRGRVWPD
jgi:hypothetical protein